MKKVYIHIGLGKTGSTSLQSYMAKASEQLSRLDFRYIQSAGGSQGVGHQQFAKSFITDIPHYILPAANPSSSRDSVRKEILGSPESNFILSSENFALADPMDLRLFFESFPCPFEYRIILFVRSQDELAESEYNQLIKVRAETRTLQHYVESEFCGDHFELAGNWENAFGRDGLICRVYDASRHSAIDDFLGCLGLPTEFVDVPVAASQNHSLGYLALIIKRGLNDLTPREKREKHFELPACIHETLGNMDLPPVLMNSGEGRQIRARFTESNKKFSSRYLGEELSDLGGRRYTDQERDRLYERCQSLIRI